MLVLCPNCNQRVPVNSYDTDVVHDCRSGNPSLDNESVTAVASHGTDVDGNAFDRSSPNLQGIANKLNGTVGGIEGEKSEDYNTNGKRVSTHRQQKKYAFFEVSK
jgi:hypothetical protein